jgi:hypothetical protein
MDKMRFSEEREYFKQELEVLEKYNRFYKSILTYGVVLLITVVMIAIINLTVG